jgi:amino acid transporter
MFYLIVFTLIASFTCYLAGFILRKFVPRYRDFQYRFSLPIIACCVGSIATLLLMTELMSYFLVEALYHFAFVRQYPEFIVGTIDFAAYVLGGYYATKHTVLLARKLDLRRIAKREYQASQAATGKSLVEVGRDLFRTEESTKTISREGTDQ